MILDPITDDAKSIPPVLLKLNIVVACTHKHTGKPLPTGKSEILDTATHGHTPSGGVKKQCVCCCRVCVSRSHPSFTTQNIA